jgi:hypothetical protein
MTSFNYISAFLICLPILIAIDKNKIRLAFVFWVILQLSILFAYLLPDVHLLAQIKYLIFLV